jgi:hypothetical protein
MYFGMSVSDTYPTATLNAAAGAKHHGVKAELPPRRAMEPTAALKGLLAMPVAGRRRSRRREMLNAYSARKTFNGSSRKAR